jgi:Tfp pilus assembly protein PilN
VSLTRNSPWRLAWPYTDMININLIPKAQQKSKKSDLSSVIAIPLEVIVGTGLLIVLVLLGVHVSFLFINLKQIKVHKQLEAEWQAIEPNKQTAESVLSQLNQLQTEQKALFEIVGLEDPVWSQQMNMISDEIPRGVWLTKLLFNEDVFFIQGSAISNGQGDMINAHNFISNLKAQDEFKRHFKDMELGSIQRRKIGTTEITDFTISVETP